MLCRITAGSGSWSLMPQNCVCKHIVELGALNTCLEPVLEPIIYSTFFVLLVQARQSSSPNKKVYLCSNTWCNLICGSLRQKCSLKPERLSTTSCYCLIKQCLVSMCRRKCCLFRLVDATPNTYTQKMQQFGVNSLNRCNSLSVEKILQKQSCINCKRNMHINIFFSATNFGSNSFTTHLVLFLLFDSHFLLFNQRTGLGPSKNKSK